MKTLPLQWWFIGMLVNIALAYTAPAQAQVAIRVNTSNSAYTDSASNVWSANTGLTGGNFADWGAIAITGTADQLLYRTERYGNGEQYAFTVPNGSYQVRLHFSENDTTAIVGGRVFDVQIEGTTVFANLDVFSQAGGSRKALIKTATVTVSDGQINILFSSASSTPMVSALEVLSAADSQAPTAPTAPTATATSSTTINVGWTASTDNVAVTGYRVERCAGASCTTFVQVGTPATNTFSDSGLAASTTYRYRIRATDATGNLSAYSTIANATTQAADTTAPSAPTGLAATVMSSTQINLSWTASTDNVGVTGYRVERCGGASCTSFAQISAPTATTYTDIALTAATSYSYRVRAVDGAGNLSAYSSTANAITQAGITIRVNTSNSAYTDSASNVWSANTGLTGGTFGDWGAIAITGTADQALYRTERYGNGEQYAFTVPNGSYQVRLHFSENATSNTTGMRVFNVLIEGVTVFPNLDVYAQAGGSRKALIKTATVTVSDGQINILFSSATSTPMVSALEILSQSGDTVAPSTPTGLAAAVISGTQINLSWTASTDTGGSGLAGYRVERCSGASCTVFAQIATPTTATYSDTGLTAGTIYRYQVRAVDGAGNLSAYSTIVSATTTAADTTAPSTPASLAAAAISTTQINLSWTASTDTGGSGLAGYRVERCAGAGCSNFAQVGTPATNVYSDVGLSASTTYVYRVRAVDGAGNLSAYSLTASATTLASAGGPSTPLGLSASPVSANQINLSWIASTGAVSAASYQVERCTGAGCSNFALVASPTTTFFNDTGLALGTTYGYRIRAVSSGGSLSNYSNSVSVTTGSGVCGP